MLFQAVLLQFVLGICLGTTASVIPQRVKRNSIAFKLVDLKEPSAACEVVELQRFGFLVETEVESAKTGQKEGLIVMEKHLGVPLHKVSAWIRAPPRSSKSIQYTTRFKTAVAVSDLTPLNILVTLHEEGDSIQLQSVNIVDFGPPGILGIHYIPTLDLYEKWFSARWEFLWEPLVRIPKDKRPLRACPGLHKRIKL
ncbi:hypothetical protein J3R30DRAFT_3403740 [Lentinula aciculospora]|uniref:Protein kinase domain-containing protein n=1 Tax=Lentinula aciculospora TaxID=153920 RepID=A0A9W9DPR5_9AGAR|nr:hypothetical protein J3R30DRAFT_3403740 [Lentinula aciculospora]